MINMTNKITTFINYDNKQHYVPASCSFSQTHSWNTVNKRSTDSSNSVQNISILQKYGEQPNTYSLSFNFIPAVENKDVWQLITEYESLVGKNVDFYYSGYPFRGLVITDGNFTIENDLIHGANRISISYNLKESIVLTPIAPKEVRLI